jgi:hypothetical protein
VQDFIFFSFFISLCFFSEGNREKILNYLFFKKDETGFSSVHILPIIFNALLGFSVLMQIFILIATILKSNKMTLLDEISHIVIFYNKKEENKEKKVTFNKTILQPKILPFVLSEEDRKEVEKL